MNLGQGLCICTSFRFLDSGLYPLDGFDFCFDLFWMAWHWKPAIADQHVPNNDPRNHCKMHYGSSSYSRFQSSELVISVEIARESRSVLCQIALWECFGDRFWPIILRDSVITVPYYNSPQPSPSPSLDLALANMENLRTKINFFCFHFTTKLHIQHATRSLFDPLCVKFILQRKLKKWWDRKQDKDRVPTCEAWEFKVKLVPSFWLALPTILEKTNLS